ncbi:MAG: AGE family epimerase/isomerase [Chitinophagaceae bacterium]|nr:AGE family epimerase/isomerase [Chitinophagaceae bacterium]
MLAKSAISPTQSGIGAYAAIYRNELIENVLPFWATHSPDRLHGGFFTCLDRFGQVYDTDKFMWLQGRQVWCFSHMYRMVDQRQEWLDLALHGAKFMQQHGRDKDGNWYFSLNREGQPLIQPYNIFSDCFATMAFAALDHIQPDEQWRSIAVQTFENIIRRKDNWKGKYNKAYPGTRPLRNFSLPMILCNLALELEHILGSDTVDALIPDLVKEVMGTFYHPEFGQVLENVNPDGTFNDSFEGRLLNPGHAIEAMWFIMDLADRVKDKELINKAKDIILSTLEHAWDKEHEGIFYFLDVKGYPVQQLEWDQKLWWVHMETLVALAKGYAHTGDPQCMDWFQKVHTYTWQHFRDEEYGEWFGYLNRRGEVLLNLKGGKWKGCFHIPRALFQVWKTLDGLA